MSQHPTLAFRYPGPPPFRREDQAIFRGRDTEITEILNRLRINKHLLIYSKSGIGKSSLLNAGILPRLEQDYLPFKLSFGVYNKENPRSPLAFLIESLKSIDDQQSLTYLDKLIFEEGSLWYHLKRLQAHLNEEERVKAGLQPREIVIIFDQFEELFTYPSSDIEQFKEALRESLFSQIPANFRSALKHAVEEAETLNEREWELLYTTIKLRIVFAIRNDRLSLLNTLTDAIPDLMKVFYEIKPLSAKQARDAIEGPAKLEGNFQSDPFTYAPALLEEIIQFLSKDKDQYIESFQIQIICQFAESIAKEKGLPQIQLTDLGSLENIFLGFYTRCIEQIPDLAQQSIARKLVEDGLILPAGENQVSGIRLNLLGEQISQRFPDMEPITLQTLLETRLLRGEPDNSGRMRYEISHDTLVTPILESRQRRESYMNERNRIDAEKKRQEERYKQKDLEIGRGGITIRWERFEDVLSRNKMVLIIGDDALIDNNFNVLPRQLPQHLKAFEQLYTYYDEDQLFWFRSPGERMKVYFQMYEFYQPRQLNDFFPNTLSKLPFSLVLSLNPSNLLVDAYKKNNPFFEFGVYNRSKPNNSLEFSASNNTLLYHLFGHIDDDESLLMSYDDVYKHLYGLMGNNPLPFEVRERLADAEIILFAGLDFQCSYLQPILWELISGKLASRYIFKEGILTNDELRASAVLGLEVIPTDFIEFSDQLINKISSTNDLNRKKERHIPQTKNLILSLIENERIEEALKMMMIDFPEAIVLLQRLQKVRHSKLNGTISSMDSDVELSRINYAARQILNEEVPQPYAPDLRQIEEAIMENNLETAIYLLRELAPDNKELIFLQSRFNALSKQDRMGTISYEQGILERNKLIAALLEIMNNLQ